jgi:tetratricopeptide (TPR) repeat protein
MVLYAEAAIECGEARFAEPLLERLRPWVDQFSYTDASVLGPVSHYLGALATVLNRYDEAEAYLDQAAALSDRVGAKFFAARTDLWRGKMLAERDAAGDAERARDLLTKAHTVASANGYGNVERRAAVALERLYA